MRISRIYIPEISEGVFTPSEETQHYLMRVLRLKHGRVIEVFDGNGHVAQATLIHIDRRRCQLDIQSIESVSVESPLNTHLALAISKGDRFDYAVQKATELGVSQITPLITEHSEPPETERLTKKVEHWQKIAIAACEQCARNTVPNINSAISLNEFLQAGNLPDLKLVLHHRSNFQLTGGESTDSAMILIGPEGGLAKNEIDQAIKAGFKEWTIGPRILRTETAPIVALTLLQSAFGDF